MLKPKQRQVIEIMVLEPDLRNEDYAERVGINPKTLYVWKKQEEFNDELHRVCKEKFKDLEKKALRKLEEQVDKGNMKAITYVLDGTGYKAPEQIEVTDKTINIHID